MIYDQILALDRCGAHTLFIIHQHTLSVPTKNWARALDSPVGIEQGGNSKRLWPLLGPLLGSLFWPFPTLPYWIRNGATVVKNQVKNPKSGPKHPKLEVYKCFLNGAWGQFSGWYWGSISGQKILLNFHPEWPRRIQHRKWKEAKGYDQVLSEISSSPQQREKERVLCAFNGGFP